MLTWSPVPGAVSEAQFSDLGKVQPVGQVQLPLPGEEELHLQPASARLHAVLSRRAYGQHRLAETGAKETQGAPGEHFPAERNALVDGKNVIQRQAPGIHSALHELCSRQRRVFPAAEVRTRPSKARPGCC
jgi:hypothetical protein